MKCSVCLNDFTEPMREISCGPVCDSCWYKSEECAEMDERLKQFQLIRNKLGMRPVEKVDISKVKHLLPLRWPAMDEAWLYKPTDVHPHHFLRVWRGWAVRNCFVDLTFARPDVAEVMKDYI